MAVVARALLGQATAVLVLASLVRAASEGSCDPLVPEYCQLPLPNNFFTRASSETPTGRVLSFAPDFFPPTILGQKIDPAEWNGMDGFSPFPSIMTYFKDLSAKGLPPHWDMAQSLLSSCPTVLLDADTGKKLAHFAELDMANGRPQRALMLWPSQRLKDNTTYIVAVRGLTNTQGSLVQPSPAFKCLRDATNCSIIGKDREAIFEGIFTLLQSAGVERSSLQLAWEFSTASLTELTGRLLHARNDALQRVGSTGPKYSITKVTDNYNTHIYRQVKGSMSVPLYDNNALPGAHLVLANSTGLPVYQGDTEATFTVLIPQSVANGSISPPRLLQYGHGLFGSQSEVESGYLVEQANMYGYILLACDWWGMAEYDVPAVAAMIAEDLGDFRIIPDRLTQAMVNAHMLMRLAKGSFPSDPTFTMNGSIKIDPSLANYYGNSQGGIMGEVYMASSTEVERGVLGVSGGPYGLLLPRSSDFSEFEVAMRILYPDSVDFSSALAMMNLLWSRMEPSAYMTHITSNPLPGTPPHKVLYHYALGDAQVNILGLYSVTRSAEAVMFESNVRCQFLLANGSVITEQLFGFPLVPDNSLQSNQPVAMGFDCGAPPEPYGNVPPNVKYDTHEGPRRSKLAQKQMEQFLSTGSVSNVCNGPCKC